MSLTALRATAVAAVILFTGCSTSRWELPKTNDPIVFVPICSQFRAPLVGKVPESGLRATYVFALYDRSKVILGQLRERWSELDLRPSSGQNGINNVTVTFASSRRMIFSQGPADRQFKQLCALDRPEVRLVHVRYNLPTEEGRIL